MKETSRLAQLFFLAVFAILGSTRGVGRANADTIGTFTGSWQMAASSDESASFQDQSVGRLDGQITSPFIGYFSYDGSISNYSEQGSGCDKFGAPLPCLVTYSGT